jgi:outer membrane protein TolC
LSRSKHKWILFALVVLTGCARFEPRPVSPSETVARLESRTLAEPRFKEFLEKNLPGHFDNWPLASWDFEELNLAALYYHPALDVARAQWHTAEAGHKTAAARLNPTMTVVPGYNISASRGVTPWFPTVTFDVPIQTAGKRGYRKAQALYLSDAARLNLAAIAWQVRSNLRTSLIDFTAAQRREALLQKQKAAQEEIIHSLEQQLQAGAISSSELALVRIVLDKIRLDLSDARQQIADARVRVAEAIGVPAKALDGIDLVFDFAARRELESDLTSAELRARALQNRADILAALSEYAASQSALQLEIAKQYPDIHLGPGYQYDQGEHKFSLSLTAELPLLNQNQGPIAQAEARRAETAARFNALEAKIMSDIDRAVATFRVAAENVSALESLAASEEKRRQAIEEQVKVGAAARFELLNAQLELAASELLQLNGRVKLQQSLGALEDALQHPVNSMEAIVTKEPPRPLPAKENKP